ncbi:hypothetical protein SCA05_25370 [Staphylococcus carnosus]|nr:hypothetical protein SCA05_25370 [Staphylococcus carnosus]
MLGEFWPIIGVIIGVALLLFLIMGLKLNTFIALIVTSMVTGIILGMPIDQVVATVEKGMGDTLGHIAIIFGLGAILGKLLSDGGGATKIADTLIVTFGETYGYSKITSWFTDDCGDCSHSRILTTASRSSGNC